METQKEINFLASSEAVFPLKEKVIFGKQL